MWARGKENEIKRGDQVECGGFRRTCHFLESRIHCFICPVFQHLAQGQAEKKNVVELGSRKIVVIKRNMVDGLEKGRLELGGLVWRVFF